MMCLIRDDLKLLGITFRDLYFRAVAGGRLVPWMAPWRKLEAGGLIYIGVLEPPKGKAPEDWEPRPQTLFKATEFGDDVDRPLMKSDGSRTYFATDIANHLDKYRRGFEDHDRCVGRGSRRLRQTHEGGSEGHQRRRGRAWT